MADKLRIVAEDNGANGIRWAWHTGDLQKYAIEIEPVPDEPIAVGDVWTVHLLETIAGKRKNGPTPAVPAKAIVNLVAKEIELQEWQQLTELPDFWMPPEQLQTILCWLHYGPVVLYGDKATGKTEFTYHLSRALGWQHPLKVDVAMLKNSQQLIGTEAAVSGSTRFVASGLFEFVQRANRSLELGENTVYPVILDEVNRIHAKQIDGLHGLFDNTGQLTISTTAGSMTMRLPSNIAFVATMNVGPGFEGVHEMDDALKSRFAPMPMQRMPFEVEAKRLEAIAGISGSDAEAIVTLGRQLATQHGNGRLSYAPGFREFERAAQLLKHRVGDRKHALVAALMGWYTGERDPDTGDPVRGSDSDYHKAFAALRSRGSGGKVALPDAKAKTA